MRIAPCPSRRPSVVRAGRRLSLLALALLSLSSAANARDPVSGARLPYRTLKDLGPKGQRITEIFSNGAPVTAPLTGPVAFAAYNVDVANAMIDLHVAAVRNSGLDTYARELALAGKQITRWNGTRMSLLRSRRASIRASSPLSVTAAHWTS